MNRSLNRIRSTVWILAALVTVALVACAPASAPTETVASSATPSSTVAPTKTPTPTPTRFHSVPPPPPKGLTLVPTSAPDLAVTISRIKMIDTSIGWAEGQVGTEKETRILRTTDGGSSWNDVSPETGVDYRAVFLLDAQLAWVIPRFSRDGYKAWRTQDGGLSWESLEGDSSWYHKIWFNDGEHGWKVSGEAFGMSFPSYDITSFSITQDGGLTWDEVNPPPGDSARPYLAFSTEQSAWVIRASRRAAQPGQANMGIPIWIHTTSDGGRSWTSRMMPLPSEAYPVESEYEGTYLGGAGNCEFLSPAYASTAIWKAALTCESKSWLYTSANQGKTWIISPMPAGLWEYVDIQFISPTVGWLFVTDWDDRQGPLYQTSDGGQSWTLIKRTGWLDVDLAFVDAQTGWAVACTDGYCSESDSQRALVKTTDGGQNWQTLEPQLMP